jgi:hypothetical protein
MFQFQFKKMKNWRVLSNHWEQTTIAAEKIGVLSLLQSHINPLWITHILER